MNKHTSSYPDKTGQQGAILVFCLIFLIILTVMATSGMDTSIIEERMAGNMQDYNQAFQAAEVALEDAENWLSEQFLLPVTSNNGTTTVWLVDTPDDPLVNMNFWWLERDKEWWTDNADTATAIDQVSAPPRYVIEEYFTSTEGQSLAIGTGELPSTRVIHRITAQGVGGSDSGEVMLQSTYIRPYD